MVIRQFHLAKLNGMIGGKRKLPYWKRVVTYWEIWLDLSRKIYLMCYRNKFFKRKEEIGRNKREKEKNEK